MAESFASLPLRPSPNENGTVRLGGRLGRSLAAALAALVVFGGCAGAQMSANPAEVGERIETLGRGLEPAAGAATAALYAPLQEHQPYAGIRVHRDLKYGAASRNRLDVFVPDPLPANTQPTLIFVHGGDFVGGDKSKPEGPFYDNVGLWAARHGLIGVNITYRLAPEHKWPAGVEDIGAAVRWAVRNVAPYGSGPDRIFIMGHGAGAAHVADYLSHPELQPPGGAQVAGAILVSGVYDLTMIPVSANLQAYYGGDPEQYAARSAVPGIVRTKIPLLVADAEFDPAEYDKQTSGLRTALCAIRLCPRYVFMARHNHFSEIYSINTGDMLLSRAISDFIKAH
jgi:acetyl esterase/lipase